MLLETLPTNAFKVTDSLPVKPVLVRVNVPKPSVPVVTVTGAVTDGHELVAVPPFTEMYFELAVSVDPPRSATLTAFETDPEELAAPILNVVVVFVRTVAVAPEFVASSPATAFAYNVCTPLPAATALKVAPREYV
jgi:hypothetical protein